MNGEKTIVRTYDGVTAIMLSSVAMFEVYEVIDGKDYRLICYPFGMPQNEREKKPTVILYKTDTIKDCKKSLSYLLRGLKNEECIIDFCKYGNV